jgi:hypothetical protein
MYLNPRKTMTLFFNCFFSHLATLSPNQCHGEEFHCNNSRCIPNIFECDFENDCGDGSDEHANCTVTNCEKSEMKCANKRCVPYMWQCDGEDDCGDNSDENQCGEYR